MRTHPYSDVIAAAAPSDNTSDRCDFLERAGTGTAAVGVLSTTGGAAFAASARTVSCLPSGADHFCRSDRITVHEVTFKNQDRMTVAGNLFVPKALDGRRRHAAIDDFETISPRPMRFITGDQAHAREFGEDAYKRAAEPKALYVVPGAGQVDLYDRVPLIPIDKPTSFFGKHLVSTGA